MKARFAWQVYLIAALVLAVSAVIATFATVPVRCSDGTSEPGPNLATLALFTLGGLLGISGMVSATVYRRRGAIRAGFLVALLAIGLTMVVAAAFGDLIVYTYASIVSLCQLSF